MVTNKSRKYDIRVFFGLGARGNLHTLLYRPGLENGAAALPDAALAATENLIVLGGPCTNLQAGFFNRGRPVKRCGSGNIAIAAFVRDILSEPGANSWSVRTPAGNVRLGYDSVSPYYLDMPLGQIPLKTPDLWEHILGFPYLAGCRSGGAEDYVLLEVNRPLLPVRPFLNRLCLYSRRALILLYRQGADSAQLRYFAPQYGPNEDAATGSACVQSALYLWYRYRQGQCFFDQKSPEGGFIHTELHSPKVAVRGQAALL